jgi:hypothetical protein
MDKRKNKKEGEQNIRSRLRKDALHIQTAGAILQRTHLVRRPLYLASVSQGAARGASETMPRSSGFFTTGSSAMAKWLPDPPPARRSAWRARAQATAFGEANPRWSMVRVLAAHVSWKSRVAQDF